MAARNATINIKKPEAVKPLLPTGNAVTVGYDYEFVEPPPNDLVCKICIFVSRDAQQTYSCCGHNFCKNCLERIRHSTCIESDVCPYCRNKNFKFVPDLRIQHEINCLLIYCPNKQMGCTWIGELQLVEKHEGECLLNVMDCPFAKVGCKHVVRRTEMKEHLKFATEQHVECNKNMILSNQQELDITKEKLKATEQELLTLKLDTEHALQQLEGRLLTKEEEAEALKRNYEVLVKERSEEIRKQYNKRTQQLEEKVDMLIRVQNCAIQKDPSVWSLLLNMLADASESGEHSLPVVIRMNDFMAEKSKKDYWWWSKGFYTNEKKGGYKMSLGVVANGYQVAAGSHVTACVFLMGGENDDNLQWPMPDSYVTIQLLNQVADSDHCKPLECRFDKNRKPAGSGRVLSKTWPISSWGGIMSSFTMLEHTRLSLNEHCQYLKNDCLYFRVF